MNHEIFRGAEKNYETVYEGGRDARPFDRKLIARGIDFIQPHDVQFVAAMNACYSNTGERVLEKWCESDDPLWQLGYIMAEGVMAVEPEQIRKCLKLMHEDVLPYALKALSCRGVTSDVFEAALPKLKHNEDIRLLTKMRNAYGWRQIRAMLKNGNANDKVSAVYAMERAGVSWRAVRKALNDPNPEVENAAIDIAVAHHIPERMLEKMWREGDSCLKAAIIRMVARLDYGHDYIYYGLNNLSTIVRLTAAESIGVCQPNELLIGTWEKQRDPIYRAAAMYAAEGRNDISDEVVRGHLDDSSLVVRAAAVQASYKRSYAPLRHPEMMSDIGYIKCVGNTVLKIKIPPEAEVRGDGAAKCRTNIATVIDVIDGYCGSNYGFFVNMPHTAFGVGDTIVAKEFDHGSAREGHGIQFAKSEELARRDKHEA